MLLQMKRKGDAHSSADTKSTTRLSAPGAVPKLSKKRLAAALLKLLRNQRLPYTLTTDEQMEAVAMLVHTGQLEATLQLVPCPFGGFPRAAVVVSKITHAGRAG